MARISGVNIPSEKRIIISLTYIFGIGAHFAKQICAKANIDESKRTKDLTDAEIQAIRSCIDNDYTVEGDLRREVSLNIKRLNDLGCYRGVRHRKRLPVRGQRTRCNARTRKGKAVAIAGKKSIKQMK